MRFARLAVAAVLVLVGMVWIGQGSGKIPGSAISGVSVWAAAGVVLVVLSIADPGLEALADGEGPAFVGRADRGA